MLVFSNIAAGAGVAKKREQLVEILAGGSAVGLKQ